MFLIPILEIIRLEEGEAGTFGILRIQKQLSFFTLEPQDRENAIGISSIPAQQYTCTKYTSQKFGETFQVQDVPGRSSILFHYGNWQEDTEGCIILGSGILADRRGLKNSREAFDAFMRLMGNHDKLHLTITEVF